MHGNLSPGNFSHVQIQRYFGMEIMSVITCGRTLDCKKRARTSTIFLLDKADSSN